MASKSRFEHNGSYRYHQAAYTSIKRQLERPRISATPKSSCWCADNAPEGIGFHYEVTAFAATVEGRFGVGAFRHLHYEQCFNFVRVRWRVFLSAHLWDKSKARDDFLTIFARATNGNICNTTMDSLRQSLVNASAVLESILHCSEFPEDTVNQKLFPHARKGWVLLREADRLGKAYPRELMELYSYTGVLLWKERDRGSFERECCWSVIYSGWH